MNLERPLFIFDLETTGLDPANDRIVQIAFQKLGPVLIGEPRCRLVNPERTIPAEATAIHHITDEMVAGQPTFRAFSKSLHEQMQGCDIGGYNVAGFDIEMLWEEFFRAGIEWDLTGVRIVDALATWRAMEPRKLIDAVEEFCGGLETLGEDGQQLEFHDAGVDVKWAGAVIMEQFHRLPEGQAGLDFAYNAAARTVRINGEDMALVDLGGALARRADGEIVFTHRKNRGVPVTMDRKYAGWILHNDGFSMNTKIHLRRALGLTEPALTAV